MLAMKNDTIMNNSDHKNELCVAHTHNSHPAFAPHHVPPGRAFRHAAHDDMWVSGQTGLERLGLEMKCAGVNKIRKAEA